MVLAARLAPSRSLQCWSLLDGKTSRDKDTFSSWPIWRTRMLATTSRFLTFSSAGVLVLFVFLAFSSSCSSLPFQNLIREKKTLLPIGAAFSATVVHQEIREARELFLFLSFILCRFGVLEFFPRFYFPFCWDYFLWKRSELRQVRWCLWESGRIKSRTNNLLRRGSLALLV